MPRLFDHCLAIYKAMDSHATDTNDGNGTRLFKGYVYIAFNEAEISSSWYGQVMDTLKRMQCLKMTQRGGGKRESEWLLFHPPTKELWAGLTTTNSTRLPSAQQKQMLITIANRLNNLEHRVDNIIQAIHQSGALYQIKADGGDDGSEESEQTGLRTTTG